MRETIATKQRVLEDEGLCRAVRQAGDRIIEAYRSGGSTYFCGNGGSAADAQHFAAELSGRFIFDRPPLSAQALHTNSSHLTAVANDYSYEEAFARALEPWLRPADVLVALSTSGNSPSIIRAAEVARSRGAAVIAMTGSTGGRLKEHADVLLNVPSDDTGRIQETHIVFVHAISEHVEHTLFATD